MSHISCSQLRIKNTALRKCIREDNDIGQQLHVYFFLVLLSHLSEEL